MRARPYRGGDVKDFFASHLEFYSRNRKQISRPRCDHGASHHKSGIPAQEERNLVQALHIRLFGKTSIQQNGQPRTDLSAKALELLCYLLIHRDRPHTREALATALWPDVSESKSKKYLRQTLWQLQTALENCEQGEQSEADAMFLLSPGWIRLNTEAGWWLDVNDFEQVYTRFHDLSGQALTAQQASTLEEAVALYQGDLLETWYQDWCIFERERLQLMYLLMLEKLMGYCEVRQLYAKGVAYGQGVLRHDRAREGAHRQLMRLYFRAGDRTAALRQYDRCVAALAEEFNLPPSQETVALSQQIRADRLEDAPHQAPGKPPSDEVHDTNLLLDLHRRLDQIVMSLSTIQHQVQQFAHGQMPSRH